MLRDRKIDLGEVNKVFASAWINSTHVAVGTKCNRLLIIDVVEQRVDATIESLKSSRLNSSTIEQNCGIHAIDVNPSKNMLATGADQPNNLAVYQLPSFDPVCVGEEAHSDWIFDLLWLDDRNIMTGGRDGVLATWHIDSDSIVNESNAYTPRRLTPTECKTMSKTQLQRIRSLAYNVMSSEVAAITLNGHLHLFDVQLAVSAPKRSVLLPFYKENVVVEYSDDMNLYAVGSHSHIFLYDPREPCGSSDPSRGRLRSVSTPEKHIAVRSIAFKQYLVSLGMGKNSLTFLDMRNHKYLTTEDDTVRRIRLDDGYVRECDNDRDMISTTDSINAVYTQRWNSFNSHLFAAGGPLPASLWGNCASVLR
ncbi:unnamed protein product [Dimorphilus gyrociliatus]|uniref:DDB1- and CUL4-associated factor 12 beta-propeller domain-containing protein n=1 Tax=Dimorphilus gyrociliatus TaxID=2664684 RepID=A0A7I8W739_9ANNE|nr:unnamed protein product [Dimorphilus gyrociliatus]